MNKLWFVTRNELLDTLRNKGLVFMGFGVPILLWVVFLVVSAIGNLASDSVQSAATSKADITAEGFVDESGIIKSTPAQIPEDLLKRYADEPSARQALEAGEISAFYLVPSDYLSSGDLVAVRSEFKFLLIENQARLINWLLLYNLIGGDPSRLKTPMELVRTDLALKARGAAGEADNSPARHGMLFLMVALFFVLITSSAGQLMRSVAREKENRMMEILMTSMTPRQLLTGKTIGQGIFGLLQMLFWIGSGYGLLWAAGRQFTLPPGMMPPPSIILWAIFFTVLGYALYASLMAGAGAMISNMKEIMPASWAAMAPLIIAYIVSMQTFENPHTLLPTALSLFPLTSPIAMLMRLTVGGVPLWQPLLALALLAVTTYFVNQAAAKLFRAQNLLSGQSFSVKRFYRALLVRSDV